MVSKLWAPFLLAAVLAAGCATEATDPKQIAKRKMERSAAYLALNDEDRMMIDRGQIRVGLPEDAVYIAWGPPAQVLASETAAGRFTTWLYESSSTDEYIFYGNSARRGPSRTYDFRDYVSAELVFRNGKLERWRTLPRPPGNTVISTH